MLYFVSKIRVNSNWMEVYDMTVKIVTDSTADLPATLIDELDITVVPEYVLFGDQVYRDRVDISEDEFYQRLLDGPIHPKTSQPTPQDFTGVYNKLSQEADGIISIHLSSKLSGTYDSAVQGKKTMERVCPIEIVDSQTVSIALGLVVVQASKMAKSGMSVQQIVGEVGQIIANVHFLILFDTLRYLAKGGRIGKAKALLGSVLNVRPLLTVRDGELVPFGQVRARSKGMERLLDFVKNAKEIQDLAILHSTTLDEARALVELTSSIFPKERTIIARLGPALGVHGGPGILAIALRAKGLPY
jgi:DegV family protein with EDD domain